MAISTNFEGKFTQGASTSLLAHLVYGFTTINDSDKMNFELKFYQNSMAGYQMIRLEKHKVIGQFLSSKHAIAKYIESDFFKINQITNKLKDGEDKNKKYFHRSFNFDKVKSGNFKKVKVDEIESEISKTTQLVEIGELQEVAFQELSILYMQHLKTVFPNGNFYFLTTNWFDDDNPILQEKEIRFFCFCHITIGFSKERNEMFFIEFFLD